MKTNTSYIHEYDILDDINECVNITIDSANSAYYSYEAALRHADLLGFFENASDSEVFMEKEKMGFFEKIGTAIINLIKKIADAIKNFASRFQKKTEEIKTDQEIVSQILQEHPDVKNEVCRGIKNEWFTYHDVAQYEKDIVGLCNMLEQHAIDHVTFKEKAAAALKKFASNGQIIITAGTTLAAGIAVVPKIVNQYKAAKTSLESLKKDSEKKGKKWKAGSGYIGEAESNNVDPKTASLIISEYSKAVSEITKEQTNVLQGYNVVDANLKAVANKYK